MGLLAIRLALFVASIFIGVRIASMRKAEPRPQPPPVVETKTIVKEANISIESLLQVRGMDRLRTLLRLLPQLGPSEVERLYAGFTGADADPLVDGAAAEWTLERWVAVDPYGALDYVSAHRPASEQWSRVHTSAEVMRRWLREDPESAISEIREREDGARILTTHYRELAEHDPATALAWLPSEDWMRERAYEGIVAGWALRDVKGVLRWVQAREDDKLRGRLLPKIFNSLAESGQLELAIHEARALSDPALSQSHQFLTQWIAHDEEAAGEWLGSLEYGDTELKALIHNNRNKWPRHPRFALATIRELSDQIGRLGERYHNRSGLRYRLGEVFEKLAREDVEATRAQLGKMPSSLATPRMIQGFLKGWAVSDPVRAMEWAAELPDDYDDGRGQGHINYRERTQSDILRAWAERDPRAAVEHAAQIGLRGHHSVMNSWIDLNHGEALQWMQSQPEELSQPIIASHLGKLVWKDLELGKALWSELPEDHRRPDHVDAIMGKWIEASPAEAAEWMKGYASEDRYAGKFGELVYDWYQDDPFAVSDYLGTLQVGANRDHGVASLARALVHDPRSADFEAALAWTLEIHDYEMRNAMLNNVYDAWAIQDLTAAETVKEHLAP